MQALESQIWMIRGATYRKANLRPVHVLASKNVRHLQRTLDRRRMPKYVCWRPAIHMEVDGASVSSVIPIESHRSHRSHRSSATREMIVRSLELSERRWTGS